jgi:histidinol-phosphate aminotransferase
VNPRDATPTHGARRLAPADLFNGYVGAKVAVAMHELGLFAELSTGERTATGDLAARLGADPVLLGALLEVARRLGYLERDGGDGIALTREGAELARLQGFFTWAVGGYGDLLGQLAPMARRSRTFAVDVFRDEGKVAVGAGEVDAALMVPILDDVLDSLELRLIADLGCGNAARLIRLCQRRPGLAGIGVDVSEDACALAREAVASAGLQARISIVRGDALALQGEAARPAAATGEVDLVCSFFMLHDLLARYERPSAALRALRGAFPTTRYFLLADTVRSAADEDAGLPIFSLGFELVHTFMNVPLYTKECYEAFFVEAELTIESCRPFGAPSSWLYLLRP